MGSLDFGDSYHYNNPVSEDLAQRVPISLQLTLMSLIISGVVALPLGVVSAIKQDTWGDYISRMITLIGLATPNFYVGIMTIFLLVLVFGWIPPLGYVNVWENPWTNMQQLIFPAIALGTSGMAFLARVTRSAMLEVLNEDYIRTARSKGLAEKIVIYRHALKNAVLPVVTIFGLALGNAASGSVVTEIVFSVPGMGRLLIEGVQHRDYPMIQAIIVIFGVMVLVANLMTDLTYAWLNPRIRYN
jgi:peptide/nickel transport system permease protein